MKRALLAFTVLAACATQGAAGALNDDQLGQKDLADGQPKDAYEHFHKALKESPQSLPIYRHLVEAARSVGKLDQLTTDAQLQVTLRPSDPLAHYRLGLCLFAHVDRERGGIEELAQAAHLAQGGADQARQAEQAELELRYGSALLEAERPDEALVPLQAAVALMPNDPHARLPLIVALHRSGRDAEVIKEITLVLPLFPPRSDVDTYRHLMDRLTSVSRAVPPSAKPRFEDALASLEQSDTPARAVDILEGLLTEQPLLAPAHAALGLAYLRSGDNAQAVFHLRKAIELDASSADPYLYLGQVFHELRRDADAQEQLEAAVARNPLLDTAREQLMQLALQRGDATTAAREARALAGIRVGDPMARMQLAQALKLAGDLAGAETQLRAVAAPLPEKPKNKRAKKEDTEPEPYADESTRLEAQLELGSVELEQGLKARDPAERGRRFAEARLWLGKVLQSQPDNVAAQRLAAALPQ